MVRKTARERVRNLPSGHFFLSVLNRYYDGLFHEQLELKNHHGLTHPSMPTCTSDVLYMPFGILEVEDSDGDNYDLEVLRRTRRSLNTDFLSPGFLLVPSQMAHDSCIVIGFGLNNQHYSSEEGERSLACYWDRDNKGDFVYSLSCFAENAVRILSRMNY